MVYRINKKISRILVALLAFVFISNSLMIPNVFAKESSSDKIFGTKQDVPIDKVWRVRFNREIEESSVNVNNVKIYDYGKDRDMPIDVSLGIDKHYLIVQLKSGTYNGVHYDGKYEYGKKYGLTISKDIASKATVKEKKKNMLYDLKMDFITRTENPYPGIPAENGTVIMKDKAYSIEYLEKNSQLANDIIKNGKYVAYYIYSKDGERIKKLLGDEATDNDPNIERVKEITYYSGDGSEQIYKWNETDGEYKLVPAAVFADITPGSKSGIVNVNAKSVNAVPGAVYYKLKHSNSIKKIGETTTFISSYPLEEISILSSNETVLAKGALDVSKDNSKYYSLMTITETLGTTAGNSNNNGSFVMNTDLDTIYRNTGDKKTMYKKDLTGSIDHQISLDNAQYINTLGQWIYYSNYSDGAKIYKVKQDGTSRQKVCDDKATYITVSGNQIFYSNHSDKGRLYVINTDSTGGTIDSAGNIHGRPVATSTGSYDTSAYDEVSYINILGDWIYYSNVSDRHKIYVVNKDGTARRKVNDEWSDCVQVVGDWIYYASATGVLSKVRKDGTGIVIPIRAKTTEVDKGYHLNVVGDWLYYSNAEDGGKLYKIKTDGSGKKYKLADLKTEYINVVGDYLYIVTGGQSKTYMLPIDTDGRVAPKLIGKNSLDDKIVKVDNIKKFVDYADVSLPIKTLEVKYLPPKVPALMSDDTYKEVTVSWDTNNVKYKDGVYTYTGTILGYGQKVILDLNIPSEMLNDTNKIIVNNNAGPNDTVEVIGTLDGNSVRLKAGDLVSVYSEEACTNLLGKGTVGTDRKVLISKLNLDPYGESIYLTVKRAGKGESKPTRVDQISAPIVDTKNVDDEDSVGIGIDGRDFSIKSWIIAAKNKNVTYDNLSTIYQNIYILPTKTILDMRVQKPVASGFQNSSFYWTGDSSIVKDSKDLPFKNGMYDLFVSAKYTAFAAPDSSGYKPQVEGNIASDAPGIMTATGEDVPAEPVINSQRVKAGSTIIFNRQLKDNEKLYLIPKEYIDKFRGWKSEMEENNPFESIGNNYKVKSEFFNGKTEITIPKDFGFSEDVLNYRDREYCLFIINPVGASNPSKNTIIVDNKAPELQIYSLLSIPYGDTIQFKYDYGNTIFGDTYTTYLVESSAMQQIRGISDPEAAKKLIDSLVSRKEALRNNGNSILTAGLNPASLAGIKEKTYKVFSMDTAGNISDDYDIRIFRNTDILDNLITAGEKIGNTITDANRRNYDAAINTAKGVLSNLASTQKQLNDAVRNLVGKLQSVDPRNPSKWNNYTNLINAYEYLYSGKIVSGNWDYNKKVNPTTIYNSVMSISTGDNLVVNSGQFDVKDKTKGIASINAKLAISNPSSLTIEPEVYFTTTKDCSKVTLAKLSTETGENAINTNGGKLQLISKLSTSPIKTSDIINKDMTWRIIRGTDVADIDQNGILTAKKNGNVTVTAAATGIGSSIISSPITITISGQGFRLRPGQLELKKNPNLKYTLTIKDIPYDFNKDADVIIKTDKNTTYSGAQLNTSNQNKIIISDLTLDGFNSISVKLVPNSSNISKLYPSEAVYITVPR